MIKNLFTKHEHRVFPGMTKEQAAQGAAWYWRSRQFGINFASAYNLMGAQYHSKLGLRQLVSVTCFDMGQGVGVDVDFSAELTDEGAVVGAVGAILVLPVAAVVGAVSYVEYERDANRMLEGLWTYMSSYSSDQKPPPGAAISSQVQTAPACPSCAASLDPDSRFCKHCGAKV